jgi:hypothetical protein
VGAGVGAGVGLCMTITSLSRLGWHILKKKHHYQGAYAAQHTASQLTCVGAGDEKNDAGLPSVLSTS